MAMSRGARALLVVFGASFAGGGCNLTKMAATQTVDVIHAGKPSVDRQDDLGLARIAVESNLAMMEGLRVTIPEDDKLLQLLAEAYTGYAFGFVEDDLDRMAEVDPDKELVVERALGLYRRGRDAGLERLRLVHDMPDLRTASDEAFAKAVRELEREDVPTAFWTANAWGSMINLGQEDPTLVLELPRVEALMKRVLELDPEYFDGGAHLFFGLMKASVPAALSDETESALEHFAEADRVAGGKNLMVKALRARFVLVAKRDRDGFVAALEEVLESRPESPRHQLVNALAKRRARRWLAEVDRLVPGA